MCVTWQSTYVHVPLKKNELLYESAVRNRCTKRTYRLATVDLYTTVAKLYEIVLNSKSVRNPYEICTQPRFVQLAGHVVWSVTSRGMVSGPTPLPLHQINPLPLKQLYETYVPFSNSGLTYVCNLAIDVRTCTFKKSEKKNFL